MKFTWRCKRTSILLVFFGDCCILCIMCLCPMHMTAHENTLAYEIQFKTSMCTRVLMFRSLGLCPITVAAHENILGKNLHLHMKFTQNLISCATGVGVGGCTRYRLGNGQETSPMRHRWLLAGWGVCFSKSRSSYAPSLQRNCNFLPVNLHFFLCPAT